MRSSYRSRSIVLTNRGEILMLVFLVVVFLKPFNNLLLRWTLLDFLIMVSHHNPQARLLACLSLRLRQLRSHFPRNLLTLVSLELILESLPCVLLLHHLLCVLDR